MDINAWTYMCGYPCMDIHAWNLRMEIHAWVSIVESTHGNPSMGIHAWVSMYG